MKSRSPIRVIWALAASIGCLSAVGAQVLSQEVPNNALGNIPENAPQTSNVDNPGPANSLGDLARQTRAHTAASDNKSSHAQDLVNEMQQEQEVVNDAPVGFR